jgi:hypothetical protein
MIVVAGHVDDEENQDIHHMRGHVPPVDTVYAGAGNGHLRIGTPGPREEFDVGVVAVVAVV